MDFNTWDLGPTFLGPMIPLWMFGPPNTTEDGIIEARVSHRKSSQQHTQAGPKKYTKIANKLNNNGAPPSVAPQGGALRSPSLVSLFCTSYEYSAFANDFEGEFS